MENTTGAVGGNTGRVGANANGFWIHQRDDEFETTLEGSQARTNMYNSMHVSTISIANKVLAHKIRTVCATFGNVVANCAHKVR